ncbi:hypothetical protein [Micromonospora sp. NBC_01739]|uniref:hypothetical protein n=1 Tax=unclassified Micromonospora TaxID=2617518 RepID=UPI002E11EADD|nr:hypothetical protein OIE53_27600 [Micromonospora sp. NBC_01739]
MSIDHSTRVSESCHSARRANRIHRMVVVVSAASGDSETIRSDETGVGMFASTQTAAGSVAPASVTTEQTLGTTRTPVPEELRQIAREMSGAYTSALEVDPKLYFSGATPAPALTDHPR